MDPEEIPVLLVLEARDKAREVVSALTHELNVMKAAGHSARAELALIGVGVATAAVGTLVAAAHSAEQYQQSLTKLQVTSHLTDVQTAALGKTIMSTAMGTTASANTMAAALAPVSGELQRVVGHTLSSADANKVLAASQDLVESSGGNLQASTKTITDLLLVYHKNAADAAQISDTLFQAHSQLGIGTDRLGMMLQRLQPRIAGSGVDMQHLLGIVREMTPAVGSGQRAIMVVGNVLQTLQNPSKTATAAFAALGFSVTDASGKFIGFSPAIDKIKGAYDRLSTAAEKNAFVHAIFGRQANVAMTLLKGGSKAIEENTQALAKNGTAADAAAKMQKTLEGQQKTLEASLSSMSTAIGTALIPALNSIMGAIVPVVTAITSFASQNPELTATILAVVAAVGTLVAGMVALGPVVGALAPLFGGLVAAAGALASPIGLVALAIGAVIVVLVKFTPLVSMVQSALGALAQAFRPVIQAVMDVVKVLSDFIGGKASLEEVGKALGRLVAAIISALEDLAMQMIHWIGDAVPKFAAALAQWIPVFVAWVADMLPKLLAALANVAVQILGWIGSVAVSVGRNAADIGVQLIRGIIGGIGSMAGALVSAIHSIPIIGNLMDIGGSVSGAAFSLGQQIAGGITSGITSGIKAATPSVMAATHVTPASAHTSTGGLRYPLVTPPLAGSMNADRWWSDTTATVAKHTSTAVHKAVTSTAGTLSASTKAAIDKILGLTAPTAGHRAGHRAGAAGGGAAGGGYSPIGAASSLAATQGAIERANLQREITAAAAAASAARGTPGELIAKQHLDQLKQELALLNATQTLSMARLSLKAAEDQLAKAHHQMVLAHEGRLKGVNAVIKAEAAYRLALEKVTLAHSKMSLAEEQLAALKQGQAKAVSAAAGAGGSMTIPVGALGEILPVGSKDTAATAAALGTAASAGAAAGVAAAQAAAPTTAALATLNVTTLNVQTLSMGPTATTGGGLELRPRTGPGAISSGFHGIVNIYLDGRHISGAISKILFEEERQYAGPVNPVTGF